MLLADTVSDAIADLISNGTLRRTTLCGRSSTASALLEYTDSAADEAKREEISLIKMHSFLIG